jgi:DNA primase
MARLPDEIVERIRREISVQRLAEARGIKLRRVGKNLMGLCPFHQEKLLRFRLRRARTNGTASDAAKAARRLIG